MISTSSMSLEQLMSFILFSLSNAYLEGIGSPRPLASRLFFPEWLRKLRFWTKILGIFILKDIITNKFIWIDYKLINEIFEGMLWWIRDGAHHL
jgi:hypothetical protein